MGSTSTEHQKRALSPEKDVAVCKKQKIPDKQHEDSLYFDAYGSLILHRIMLEDTIRTECYKNAIDKKRFENKVVLDVGCGTGVLSIFSAKAGAKKVYAVDGCKRIADLATKLVASNNFSDTITVINAKVEDLELPEKVDVIVSEWMGYCLIYESMFQSVLLARDKFLKEGGLILPEKAVIKGVPFTNQESLEHTENFWNSNPYGIDYSVIGKEAISAR